jgi:hypothetical protein
MDFCPYLAGTEAACEELQAVLNYQN